MVFFLELTPRETDMQQIEIHVAPLRVSVAHRDLRAHRLPGTVTVRLQPPAPFPYQIPMLRKHDVIQEGLRLPRVDLLAKGIVERRPVRTAEQPRHHARVMRLTAAQAASTTFIYLQKPPESGFRLFHRNKLFNPN